MSPVLGPITTGSSNYHFIMINNDCRNIKITTSKDIMIANYFLTSF